MPKFHKIKQGGLNILLDINNGGVHVVDEDVFDMSEEEIASEFGLGAEDDYADYADMNVDAPLKAMCMLVSQDCNLRCKYCFADDLVKEAGTMTPETAQKAVDFLIQGSQDREHLEIDFFGGEPLLAWDTVIKTVEYAEKQAKKHNKQFKLTITTNGIALDDEKIAYINAKMSNVVMSLDGRSEVNDRMRGKGVFNKILPSFKKLVKARDKKDFTDYFIRGTFTGYNLDFTDDVLAIAGEGFKNISIEPVTAEETAPYAIRKEHIPRIRDEYDKLFNIMRENENSWSFFHLYIDLHNAPCILKRLRGCGAGNEYIAVTPDGNIYPCHRYAGLDEWKMGNINSEGFSLSLPIKQYFSKTHIYAKDKCKECWARFYCGGGCNAEFYVFEGDANKPSEIFCELMKKRLECAIALAVHREFPAN